MSRRFESVVAAARRIRAVTSSRYVRGDVPVRQELGGAVPRGRGLGPRSVSLVMRSVRVSPSRPLDQRRQPLPDRFRPGPSVAAGVARRDQTGVRSAAACPHGVGPTSALTSEPDEKCLATTDTSGAATFGLVRREGRADQPG